MAEPLQKAMARRLNISRRKAEVWMAEGKVLVNGRTALLGCRIEPTDRIVVNGKLLEQEPPWTSEIWMFYKPRGIVCTHRKYPTEKNLWSILPKKFSEPSPKWICVGRLDKDSEGLLLLTNNGSWAHRMGHPSFGIFKYYQVTLNQPLDPIFFGALKEGLEDHHEHLHFTDVKSLGGTSLEVQLSHGKKREIRRLLAHFNRTVIRLKRVQIGCLSLPKTFGPGNFQLLSPMEIELIFK
ncbi:MAG: pseudouridine synthase [Puniceicoccales bacterium]|jgi:23S rRNA pseudouridine2605 synthase|nr:pseudouridine synthase [Puniceicoccales bacterium]